LSGGDEISGSWTRDEARRSGPRGFPERREPDAIEFRLYAR
jgi:hypothetical protein